MKDVVIVGAGVAGLSCAQALQRRGITSLILERARGVGGRCATRRVQGQPVDHGLAFLHGRAPEFLAALDDVQGANPVPDWPREVVGNGLPCQPRAFAAGERRLAFAEGVSAFPKHLADRLDVRLEQRVDKLTLGGGALEVQPSGGPAVKARVVVFAMALEQARGLLASLPDPSPRVLAARGLLEMFGSLSCWTVLAGFPLDQPAPSWEMLYPDQSEIVALVAHDSSKRRDPAQRVLVIQALPRWSSRHLEHPPERVIGDLLGEAGRIVGPWVARPAWAQAHRWRYARTDSGTALARPLLLPIDGGVLVGIAGEAFHPAGGAEGAWLSGLRMAQELETVA